MLLRPGLSRRRWRLFSRRHSPARVRVCVFWPHAARGPPVLGQSCRKLPLALGYPLAHGLVGKPEFFTTLGNRLARGDHVVGGLAPELLGVLVWVSIYHCIVLSVGVIRSLYEETHPHFCVSEITIQVILS
ncbi:hypothetical protein HMPREF9069_00865 [Atopobium sp. oral taxon 810 str. F0209]|nr:hypothetical protein HMPREF9069_00865 [Atopobium sp. oral taxon 810 str. F0209]